MYTSIIFALFVSFFQAAPVSSAPVAGNGTLEAVAIEKRQLSPPPCGVQIHANCGGNVYLDHAGVDQSADWLKGWAGAGNTISTEEENLWIGQTINNAVVYACTDDHHGSNTFSAGDVADALAAMDKACAPYQQTWAIWYDCDNGHNTGKIIGKAAAGTPICQGYNGGS